MLVPDYGLWRLDGSKDCEPKELHLRVKIVVDADAGTVSTYFDDDPRALVFSGFPPGVALRPWAVPTQQTPPLDPERGVYEGIDGAESVAFDPAAAFATVRSAFAIAAADVREPNLVWTVRVDS